MLESQVHQLSCFVTLTYDQENYPLDGSVSPDCFSGWIKRLRSVLHPLTFRFFGVGEYGNETFRAHYHAILFGVGADITHQVHKSWGKGFVTVVPFSVETARYIAGYAQKKMYGKSERVAKVLAGRHPEFSRQSLRPGIGASEEVLNTLQNFLESSNGCKLLSVAGDVPATLKFGGRDYPLGPYIRRKLRERMGITPAESAYIREKKAELRALFKASGAVSQMEKSDVLADVNAPRVLQAETRAKIFQSSRSL